jgi:alkaline phosphatase
MKLKYISILFIFGLLKSNIKAQNYTLQKCHAHNDYVHKSPFYEAYNLGFGSIEVDVFFVNNQLYVAHDKVKIDSTKTLHKLYIEPILAEIEKNIGKLKQPLQLLIDLKTGGETLKTVENQLIAFKSIFKKAKVSIVISGEMPAPAEFGKFDEMINFDGRDNVEYSKAEAKRLALYSASLLDFVKWTGKGQLDDDQTEKVESFVKKIHKKGKKLRFWATPDTPTAWTTLMNLKLDYVGTDNLTGLAKFLE